jgi:hypothetical protein
MKHFIKNYLLLLALLLPCVQQAQNVAVNATGTAANTSAGLDVDFTTKGFLLPRMTAAQRAAISAPATGLIIYQTDAGTMGSGFYFYNGAVWVPWGTNNGGWGLLGNAATVSGTNFIGTTDAQSLDIRTNGTLRFRIPDADQVHAMALGTAALPFFSWSSDPNTGIYSTGADEIALSTAGTEKVRLLSNGRMGIGIAAPTSMLEVVSTGVGDGIYGRSPNCGGYLGRETNITFGTPLQTLQGAGVYAANPTAGYTSFYGQSTGAATVAATISFSSVWIASYNYVENPTGATGNPPALYGQLNNSTAALGGFQTAISGYSSRGTTAGNPGYTVGGRFTGDAQNQDAMGVIGIAYTNTNNRAGGYFEGNNYAGTNFAFAYVATSTGGVNRKITGTNSVSEIIPTANHGRIILTCPESPEYWYQDYGTVKLVNGRAHVDLDPILADIIIVNEENPLRVFCTPVDMLDYNGVAIINKTPTGFDMVEVNGGTHSGTIDYQLIVKPKTNFGEGRFPQAPGPAWLKASEEPSSAKAKNNPADGRAVFQWPSDYL